MSKVAAVRYGVRSDDGRNAFIAVKVIHRGSVENGRLTMQMIFRPRLVNSRIATIVVPPVANISSASDGLAFDISERLIDLILVLRHPC